MQHLIPTLSKNELEAILGLFYEKSRSTNIEQFKQSSIDVIYLNCSLCWMHRNWKSNIRDNMLYVDLREDIEEISI